MCSPNPNAAHIRTAFRTDMFGPTVAMIARAPSIVRRAMSEEHYGREFPDKWWALSQSE